MSKESRDYLEMSFESIRCFADDGRLDARELRKLIDIARRDGVMDPNEMRVLRSIIAKIRPEEVDAEMRQELLSLGESLGQR
ncbi:hypothetical protein [Pseudomarimonas arenosa]|uniref:Tellurite resistance protein TerB n=1 Tax=Pseudomarimonas arenosa TaxID=2774145 RepID=A0AAW3ZM70_9GAMM|nr:hypothetical protein [Pseudomarimonas arenosa]MBD8525749.1 hypothetical protein [Pseudomarimonas arenosa]